MNIEEIIPKADREEIARILSENIHFGFQVEAWVLGGAIDALLTRERQRAIEFAEWVAQNAIMLWEPESASIKWVLWKPIGGKAKYDTTAELYDLYLQSIKQ